MVYVLPSSALVVATPKHMVCVVCCTCCCGRAQLWPKVALALGSMLFELQILGRNCIFYVFIDRILHDKSRAHVAAHL